MARFLHDGRHNDSRLGAAKLRITTHSDKICNARFSSQTMPKPKIPPTGRRMRVQSLQRTLREIPCSKLQRKDNLNNKTRTRINHISLFTLCAFLCILNSHPLALSSSTNRTDLFTRTGTWLKKRFAIVIAKYFRNLCWKTISVHNNELVLSLKSTILYIFTPENKICRNIALKITKYDKIFYIYLGKYVVMTEIWKNM